MIWSLRALFAAFLLSGFCGLIYQSIWSHYLRLFLGHAAHGQTVVLVVFIGGMAIGAWLAGERSAKLRRPLVAYAAAEAAVGAVALLFHDLYGAVTSWAYEVVLPTACAAEGTCVAQWAVAVALILPQSILLGTTFPLMSAGVLRRAPELPGSRIALLYFLNSLGAVFGVLVSAFVLIPAVGLPGTQLVAGVGNIAVAALVYGLARSTDGPANHQGLDLAAADDCPADAPTLRRETRVLLAIAALTGLSSFIYEVAWIRMLAMVLGASTQAFEVMLASFILGLALGGWFIARRIDRAAGTLRTLALVQVAMGSLAIATLVVYDATFAVNHWILQALDKSDAGATAYTVSSTVIAMAVMLPTTICAGMTLPLITYRLLRLRAGERAIGRVYGVNTLGGIIGVIAAVHVLLPLAGVGPALIVGGAIDIVLGVVLLARFCPGAGGPVGRAVAAVGVIVVVAATFGLRVDARKAAAGVFRGRGAALPAGSEVVYARDGKTATIHAIRYPGQQVAIATNGKSDGALSLDVAAARPRRDEWTMTLTGALPLLLHPGAKRMALIGFGTGMSTATATAASWLEAIDTIEIEPAMIEGARVFAPITAAAYDDPRSRLVVEDAKSFFARGTERYDIIVAEPSNPWVSGVASLFSREFYASLRRYLHADGVLVQWVQSYETDVETIASVLAALQLSFPRYALYEATAGDLLIVAPMDPRAELRFDPQLLASKGMAAWLGRLGIDDVAQLRLRKVGSDASLRWLGRALGVPANSDFYPFVEHRAPRARLRGANAKELTEVASAPVPILEMLEGDESAPDGLWRGARALDARSGSPRQAQLAAADAALDLALMPSDATATAARIDALDALDSDGDRGPRTRAAVQLARATLLRCPARDASGGAALSDDAPLLEAAHTLAASISPFVRRARAHALWRGITSAPCHPERSPRLRAWLDLFSAVADRDAEAMRTLGRGLLRADAGAPPNAVEYALMAAMVGDHARGRGDDARALFAATLPRLRPGADRSVRFIALSMWGVPLPSAE